MFTRNDKRTYDGVFLFRMVLVASHFETTPCGYPILVPISEPTFVLQVQPPGFQTLPMLTDRLPATMTKPSVDRTHTVQTGGCKAQSAWVVVTSRARYLVAASSMMIAMTVTFAKAGATTHHVMIHLVIMTVVMMLPVTKPLATSPVAITTVAM